MVTLELSFKALSLGFRNPETIRMTRLWWLRGWVYWDRRGRLVERSGTVGLTVLKLAGFLATGERSKLSGPANQRMIPGG